VAKPLNIVADAHIWGVEKAFSSFEGFDVKLQVIENKEIISDNVKQADVLLTRSGVQVNGDLLQGSRVRFAATATIGDDHYDKAWLDAHAIQWATAAGSSTGSVLEYILASLLVLQDKGRFDLCNTTLGVIGAGRIGGQLARICSALGIKVLINDPPRARLEAGEDFVSLDDVLERADILTLHTPLIKQGLDQTYHLLDKKRLQAFKGYAVINAARGACVDNEALLQWLNCKHDALAILDCWEHEPAIDVQLLAHQQCMIATAHIAGHSLDGKAANTQYIYDALCAYLGVKPVWNMQDELPAVQELAIEKLDNWPALRAQIERLYPIMRDVEALKASVGLEEEARAKCFVHLRRHYPVRRAWEKCSNVLADILQAKGLGVNDGK